MPDIKLVIQNESDLYNPFDPSILSDDVVAFVKDRIDGVRSGLTLTIVSDAPVDTERMKRAVAVYVNEQRQKLALERRWNLFRQLRLFLIGVVFIALRFIVSSGTERIWLEVLSIIGSFAVWEATSIWLIKNPDTRIKKMLIRLLENIDITCTDNTGTVL